MTNRQETWQDHRVSSLRGTYPYGVIVVDGASFEPALRNSFVPNGVIVEARRTGRNTMRVRRVLSDGSGGRTYGGEETWVDG